MIFVSSTETPECSLIVAHDSRTHALRNDQLPCVILAHAPGTAPLSKRNTFSMHSVDALPCVARQVRFDGLGIGGSLEHFRHSDGADPKLRSFVPFEPRNRRSLYPIRDLVKQINKKGGIQQAFLHLRDTRRRTSPMRLTASTSTSVPLTKGSRTLSGVHVIHACVEVLGGE